MSSGADLFVICKQCGSEVSPYITECPYCGTRLRKRAPKLDKGARAPRARRALPTPALGRIRRGEIPGIRADSPPYVTAVLVIATCGLWIAWRGGYVAFDKLIILGPPHGDWWRLLTSLFAYHSGIYQFATLIAVALFGWLSERRHGPLVVLGIFLAAGVGGELVELAVYPDPLASGANGAALGLLAAWAVPDLLARRAREHYEGDLLGAAVIAAALLAMSAARVEASLAAGIAGGLIGLVLGLGLARVHPN